MKFTPRLPGVLALAMTVAPPGFTAPKVPAASGTWESLSWLSAGEAPAPAPTDGDDLYVANKQAVTFASGELAVRSLQIGTDGVGYAWLTPEKTSGALIVSGGTLAISGPRFRLGTAEGAKAVLDIRGGTIEQTDASAGGRMETGCAKGTTTLVKLAAGRLVVGGMYLSRTEGSATEFVVSGGRLEITGTGGNPYVALKGPGRTTAFFEQTGGTVTIGGNRMLFVGVGSKAGEDAQGTVRLAGGVFRGRIGVGGETGSGTLIVGAAADIAVEKAGGAVPLVIGKTGRIIFELGGSTAFTPVNLTGATRQALTIGQAGATLVVDGTKLPAGRDLAPITLLTFRKGCGPTKEQLINLRVGYTGFAKELKPALVWTPASLQLQFR